MATKHKAAKSQPSSISNAIKLLYLALDFEIFQLVLNASALSKIAPIGSIIFTNFLILAAFASLIFLTSKGKNWARLVLLAFSAITIPFSAYSLLNSPVQLSQFSPIVGIVAYASQIIALILLFQKQSADWFASKH